eukprot:2802613-Pleurochrysis_carterae.AAC.1
MRHLACLARRSCARGSHARNLPRARSAHALESACTVESSWSCGPQARAPNGVRVARARQARGKRDARAESARCVRAPGAAHPARDAVVCASSVLAPACERGWPLFVSLCACSPCVSGSPRAPPYRLQLCLVSICPSVRAEMGGVRALILLRPFPVLRSFLCAHPRICACLVLRAQPAKEQLDIIATI